MQPKVFIFLYLSILFFRYAISKDEFPVEVIIGDIVEKKSLKMDEVNNSS